MPLYNTKPVFLILIPLLMLHRNSNSSFKFPNAFGPYRNDIITYQGDAVESNGTIQLTNIENDTNMPYSAGRASYILPIRLWDPKIGLANFTTTFSFLVTSNEQSPGVGVSFFIAPYHSKISESSSDGYLGLVSPETVFNTFQNQIVAVEFDTFQNELDHTVAHVGIYVNSSSSVTMVKWGIDNVVNFLTPVVATVSYEALTHQLNVDVSSLNGTKISLSHEIDLREVLPDGVSVGFSGVTGRMVETLEILSWTFSSNLY